MHVYLFTDRSHALLRHALHPSDSRSTPSDMPLCLHNSKAMSVTASRMLVMSKHTCEKCKNQIQAAALGKGSGARTAVAWEPAAFKLCVCRGRWIATALSSNSAVGFTSGQFLSLQTQTNRRCYFSAQHLWAWTTTSCLPCLKPATRDRNKTRNSFNNSCAIIVDLKGSHHVKLPWSCRPLPHLNISTPSPVTRSVTLSSRSGRMGAACLGWMREVARNSI